MRRVRDEKVELRPRTPKSPGKESFESQDCDELPAIGNAFNKNTFGKIIGLDDEENHDFSLGIFSHAIKQVEIEIWK